MISARPRARPVAHARRRDDARATSRAMTRAVVLRSDHAGRVSTRSATGSSSTATPSANSVATNPRSVADAAHGVVLLGRRAHEAERPVGHDAGEPPGQHDATPAVMRPCSSRHVDLHVAPELTAEQVVHDVARSLLAVGRRCVDRRARARAFVDRGADDTTRVEVDDEVGQRRRRRASESAVAATTHWHPCRQTRS